MDYGKYCFEQQKREKEAQAMREAVAVGDEVCTAGGIVGIVLKVEEDTVVLETGAERNRIRIKKWAIHENITQIEAQQAAERERKAARQRGIATSAADTDTMIVSRKMTGMFIISAPSGSMLNVYATKGTSPI